MVYSQQQITNDEKEVSQLQPVNKQTVKPAAPNNCLTKWTTLEKELLIKEKINQNKLQ